MEWTREGCTLTDDPARIDMAAVHRHLRDTYWAKDIPGEVVRRAFAHSLAFALLDPCGATIGFCRAVTDRATFAYLCDVYVSGPFRGRGLGDWMIGRVLEHPDLRGLRRINLVTRDAHGLYARHGFVAPSRPQSYMERLDPDVYKRAAGAGDCAG